MKQASQVLNRVADGLYRTGEGTYFARFQFKGKSYKKTLGTHDRKTADRKLSDYIKEIESERKELPHLTFANAAEKWLESLYQLKAKSKGRRDSAITNLKPAFKGQKLHAITLQNLSAWATKRAKQCSARTFNIERETLILLFGYAQKTLGVLTVNLAKELPKMKVKKTAIIPPTREQFAELVELLDHSKRLKKKMGQNSAAFIRFLAYTGMRLEEARCVLWEHVDFAKGTLLVTGNDTGTKNHSQRTIPLFPAVRELLEKFPKADQLANSPVFEIVTAGKLLKTASETMGMEEGEHFNHHDMRHFFCSNAIELLIPDHVIAHWLGHKDGGILVKTTYGHLRKNFSDAEALKMTFTS